MCIKYVIHLTHCITSIGIDWWVNCLDQQYDSFAAIKLTYQVSRQKPIITASIIRKKQQLH